MEILKPNKPNDVAAINNQLNVAESKVVNVALLPVSKYTMSDEHWKPLADINARYLISNYGRIIDIQQGVKVYPSINASGYQYVKLTHYDGNRYGYCLHRLVALSFCDGYNPAFDVDHIDNDPSNNYYRNLRWVTKRYNRGVRNVGKSYLRRAPKVPCLAIPCDPKVCNVESLPLEFDSLSSCAKYFGVAYESVRDAEASQEYLIKGYQIIAKSSK